MRKTVVTFKATEIRFEWIKKECSRLGITKQELLTRMVDAAMAKGK